MIDYEDSCYGCDYHEEDGGCTCPGDCNDGSGRIIGRIPGTLPESNMDCFDARIMNNRMMINKLIEEQHKKCRGCKFYPWSPNHCDVGLSFSAYAGQCAAYKPTLLTKIKMWLRGLIQNDKW